MAIPKIIHQTWKNEDIPDRWKDYQQKVRDLNPDWDYKLWTDDDNDAFIEEHYPELIDIFRQYPRPVMRADVIRYAIMDKIGGLYLDLDYEMLKPFDIQGHVVLPKSRDKSYGDEDDRIGNCILASEPGHEFWKVVLDDLTNNSFMIGHEEIDVEKATGPYLLTRIYHSRDWQGIETPARILFHPPSPRNESSYREILQNGKSYGIHHAHGSWREPQWKKFLRKVIGLN